MAIATSLAPDVRCGRLRFSFVVTLVFFACFLSACRAKHTTPDALDDQTARELAAQVSREAAADSAEHRRQIQEVLARALPSQTPSSQLWSGFRRTFPYHIQVLALSEPASDDTRTLIASEPPPDVTLEDVLL